MERRVYGEWADVVFTISHSDTQRIVGMVPDAKEVRPDQNALQHKRPAGWAVTRPVHVEFMPFTPSIRNLQTPSS